MDREPGFSIRWWPGTREPAARTTRRTLCAAQASSRPRGGKIERKNIPLLPPRADDILPTHIKETNMTGCFRASWLPVALLSLLASPCLWSQAPPQITPEQMENFLKTAKILKTKPASKGTTGTLRATLSDG